MKKLSSIIVMVILIFLSSGCKASKQELDKLAIVIAMGFDITSEDKYLATVQILNPQKQAFVISTNNKIGDLILPDTLEFSAIGDSPYDAVDNISTQLGKGLFFGHGKYIVVGRELAENGLMLLVDTILRGYETRPDALLLLTRGKASEIISSLTTDEKIPANAIENLIKLQVSKGYTSVTSRLNFSKALLSKTRSPILGVIDVKKGSSLDSVFKVAGTAVFKKR